MNFLAHAYLSFGNPGFLAGNMISDFVKGKKQYDYPTDIQKGIRLHRAIDSFTDEHPLIKEMKKPFAAHYGLYAGALVDVACDYLLANDPTVFSSDLEVKNFAMETYSSLDKQLALMPANFREIYYYMKKFNWLYNYRFVDGIEKSFHGIARRAKYMDEAETAFQIFIVEKDELAALFREFFPLLKSYSRRLATELERAH